jgi:hypothetical protein
MAGLSESMTFLTPKTAPEKARKPASSLRNRLTMVDNILSEN